MAEKANRTIFIGADTSKLRAEILVAEEALRRLKAEARSEAKNRVRERIAEGLNSDA